MRSYAGALLETCDDSQVPEVLKGLKLIASAFGYSEFKDTLFEPNTTDVQKSGLLQAILLDAGIDIKDLNSFIEVTVDKRREGIFETLHKTFESLAYARKRISKALVLSAMEINEEDQAKIEKKLKELIGKPVELEIENDKALLGGIKVFVDDQELDLSIQGQIRKLSKQMISEGR
jgi:F-type H+-transporting ATPase subunit delta